LIKLFLYASFINKKPESFTLIATDQYWNYSGKRSIRIYQPKI